MKSVKVLAMGVIVLAIASSSMAWQSPAAWVATKAYNGDYAKAGTGDTVTYKDYDGKPMYWWAKWSTTGDIPGTITKDSGGTNPWVFMNMKEPRKAYKCVTAADVSTGSGSDIKAIVPTYKDGAKGCYSIHHDDMCGMGKAFITNSFDIANRYGIQLAWGAKVDQCEESGDWYALMKKEIQNGHEVTCHSWNHSSAADQWAWVYPGKDALHSGTLGEEWLAETKDTILKDFKADSTLTTGTSYTNTLGQVLSVDMAKKLIKTNSKAWDDAANGSVKMVKYFSKKGWTTSGYDTNVTMAKRELDTKAWGDFAGNRYFPKGKKTEFFIYPYDAFSQETHLKLLELGFISARGGSKSGKVHRGDLSHPFFIDFDAYFLQDNDDNIVVPINPHKLLSIQGMVDQIVEKNGYMIREFHAVADNGADYWGAVPKAMYESHMQDLRSKIDKNDIAVMTVSEAVKYAITRNSVTSDKPTVDADGADKWKITVAATGANAKYQDEICVVVQFTKPFSSLGVSYVSGGDNPRWPPRKLDSEGKLWSVSVNPYKGALSVVGGGTAIVQNGQSIVKASIVSINKGVANIRLNSGNFKVTLFNVNGKAITTVSGNTADGFVKANLNTKGLATGFYMMKVEHKYGVLNQRVVIAD